VPEQKWDIDPEKVKRMEELRSEMDDIKQSQMQDVPVHEMPADNTIEVDATPIDENMEARLASIDESIRLAKESGRFIAAMFYRVGDTIHLRLDRHEFGPEEDFGRACDLLREQLLGEVQPEQIKPLPRANPEQRNPMKVLFGEEDNDQKENGES
jgi:hypothetical protein